MLSRHSTLLAANVQPVICRTFLAVIPPTHPWSNRRCIMTGMDDAFMEDKQNVVTKIIDFFQIDNLYSFDDAIAVIIWSTDECMQNLRHVWLFSSDGRMGGWSSRVCSSAFRYVCLKFQYNIASGSPAMFCNTSILCVLVLL